MKKVLLVVGLVVLFFSQSSYAEVKVFCEDAVVTVKDESELVERGGLIFVFDTETKEVKALGDNDITLWKYKNFVYQNNKILLKNVPQNDVEWNVLIDFNREIINLDAVGFPISFKYIRCKNFEELVNNLENKTNTPSISTEDQNTVVAASSGTGFFVSSNGHMVTNNHVIDSCDTVKAHYKGREIDVDVLFTDRSNDLAIIKANVKPEKVFPVSNEDVSLLEDIIVAGYPLGKNISASIKTFKGSVTALAGFGDNYSNFQIDASLSSGNSGGPIINQKGNVVGVAVEKLVEVGVEGFNFGVKSSTLKTFASSNQIKFQEPSTEELSNKELGQLITEATIYLECWMSVAKIKLIIEEGERQKAFFSEYK